MEQIFFLVFFNNVHLECTGTLLRETEQTEIWHVISAKRNYTFQNNWPFLKSQNSMKKVHWRMIKGEILNVDHAKEECEEIALALENAIKRSQWKPNVSAKSW